MADEKTEKKRADKPAEISFGEFELRSMPDRGEARFAGDFNIVSHHKTANRQLEQGATYEIFARKVKDVPAPKNVVVEIPADEVSGLSPNAKVLREE